jgi:protein gp37
MAETSAIEWTDSTVNFWWGCTKVSAACDHCYAETWAKRFGEEHWGIGAPRRKIKGARALLHRLDNDYAEWAADRACGLLPPLSGARRRVFCMSMGDLFDNEVPLDWFAEAWRTIVVCNRVDIIIVTKRLSMIERRLAEAGFFDWPKHAWLLTSVCDQNGADREGPRLLDLKARFGIPVIGFSIEPMLGSIVLPATMDWVIAGGESGPNARPSHPDWFRGLRDQCAAAGVAYFFKQWGEWHTAAVRLSDDAAVFRQFDTFQQWVNKANTWVNGGICLDKAGRILSIGADMMRARDEGTFPVTIMHRVGKRRAGRLLDGREHNAFPEPRS